MRKLAVAMMALVPVSAPAFSQVTGYPSAINQLTGDCASGPAAGSSSVTCTKANGGGIFSTYSARTVSLAATGDPATISIPANITKYQVTSVQITNCSATPVLAQPSIYTAASAGGNNIVAAATITAATSAPVVINSALVTTNTQSSASLFVHVTVANSTALTCDFYISIKDMT